MAKDKTVVVVRRSKRGKRPSEEQILLMEQANRTDSQRRAFRRAQRQLRNTLYEDVYGLVDMDERFPVEH